jgi:hypothetical protein
MATYDRLRLDIVAAPYHYFVWFFIECVILFVEGRDASSALLILTTMDDDVESSWKLFESDPACFK